MPKVLISDAMDKIAETILLSNNIVPIISLFGFISIITPTTTTSVFGGNIWEAIIIIVLPGR